MKPRRSFCHVAEPALLDPQQRFPKFRDEFFDLHIADPAVPGFHRAVGMFKGKLTESAGIITQLPEQVIRQPASGPCRGLIKTIELQEDLLERDTYRKPEFLDVLMIIIPDLIK